MHRHATPHPDAHCRRKGCYLLFKDHGEGWACPDGKGVFKRLDGHRSRASTSFALDEVDLLNDVMNRLLAGEDMRGYARHSNRRTAITGIVIKSISMRDSITRRNGGSQAG